MTIKQIIGLLLLICPICALAILAHRDGALKPMLKGVAIASVFIVCVIAGMTLLKGGA